MNKAMMRFAPILLLSACSTIDYSTPPPEDFPALKITIHEYDGGGAREACGARYAAWRTPMPSGLVACAEYRFDTMTCDIHVPRGNTYLLTYERAKCAGYGNAGDTSTVDKWNAWKARR